MLMKFAQESSGYADADGDGFGAGNAIALNCIPVAGLVLNNTDCNDSNQNIFPGATDQCNGIDDDCDGIIDENLPDAFITPLGNLDICLTGSVDLQANGGAGLSYQWLKNNNNIPGATNQIYTATTKGSYKVAVTASGTCTSISLKTKVINSCKLGEEEFEEFELFPNPASTQIQFMNPFEQAVLIISNLIGEILLEKKIYGVKNNVDVSALTSGVYFIRLISEKGTVVKSFVKE
jgi:hypothetical protein